MFKNEDITEIIADEIIIIETSGEMPEVAFHGSVYYLTTDDEGPGLTLAAGDLLKLKIAVVEGYRRIIIRDLMLENRDKGLYRGLRRCAVNWERLANFCQREGMQFNGIAKEVAELLAEFLQGEINDIQQGRQICINCSARCLCELAAKVGLPEEKIPTEIIKLLP